MKFSTLALLIALCSLVSTLRAFAMPPFRPVSSANSSIVYHGGPVISHVKVVGVFWGATVDPEVQAKVGPFYQALSNSTYFDVLSEYQTSIVSAEGKEGTHQTIGRGVFLGNNTLKLRNSANNLTQADVENELEYQLSQGGLPKPDADTLYMIHYPKSVKIRISFGGSCESWGADHEVYNSKTYGSVYYAMMPDCGYAFDKMTIAASHEFAEAITDPHSPLANQPSVYPAAWIDSEGSEIGDVCAWMPAKLNAGNVQYTIQKIWQLSKNDCSDGTFTSARE